MKRAVVVGAGIAGLAAANKLKEEAREKGLDLQITVLEKENRVGGTILTEKKDGFIIEGGPDCFLSAKPWALELASRLGIGNRVCGTVEENRGTFILWDGKLHPLPEGVYLMVPTKLMPLLTSGLLTWRGKLRMAMEFFVPKRTDGAEETLAQFVTRRLGAEALERIAEPLVAGVHAGEPETMSLEASFPRFKDLEDRHSSMIRGMLAMMRKAGGLPRKWTMFVSLRDGLAEFPRAVAEAVGGENIRTGVEVSSIERADEGWRLHVSDGESINADAVILASPAHVSSRLVSKTDADLSSGLAAIPYVGTATVSMAYEREELQHIRRGFGFVVPRHEKRKIMAATFSDRKFPNRAPEDKALLRCFLGGSRNPELLDKPPGELARIAADEIADILEIKARPQWAKVYKWPRSMPQTPVGYKKRMSQIRSLLAKHPCLEIAGGAYDGLGIPDCVRSGEEAACSIIEKLYSKT